jgi:uncharacterized protein with HEPN domain
MQRKTYNLLSDMLDALKLIEDFAHGHTLNDLGTNRMLRSALYYQFAIIGEALSQLRSIDAPVADQITDARRIIGFRNQIIHGYAAIQDNITWQVIQDYVPILKNELIALLGEV